MRWLFALLLVGCGATPAALEQQCKQRMNALSAAVVQYKNSHSGVFPKSLSELKLPDTCPASKQAYEYKVGGLSKEEVAPTALGNAPEGTISYRISCGHPHPGGPLKLVGL